MKIVHHSLTPPARPATGVPVRGIAAGNDLNPQAALGAGPRPVRISRYPEEAALFAYNRQAQPHVSKPQPSIDEYV